MHCFTKLRSVSLVALNVNHSQSSPSDLFSTSPPDGTNTFLSHEALQNEEDVFGHVEERDQFRGSSKATLILVLDSGRQKTGRGCFSPQTVAVRGVPWIFRRSILDPTKKGASPFPCPMGQPPKRITLRNVAVRATTSRSHQKVCLRKSVAEKNGQD